MWLHRQEVDIMDSEKVIKRDNEYVLHTYARNPIAIEKGLRFAIREGGRTVGSGVVTEVAE